MSELDPRAFQALTFDCYGTLIDWNRGMAAAIAALPSLRECDHARLVQARHQVEIEVEAGPYLPYREVLARSLTGAARALGREPAREELEHFADSVGSWPPFDESPPVLARLARRYRLAILSNIETRTLEASVELLGAPFPVRVTAEEVRSYKPARAHFDEGLRRLELPAEAVLHVAQSYFHDIRPTREMGWSAVWVNREDEARPEGPAPSLEVRNLTELADLLGC